MEGTPYFPESSFDKDDDDDLESSKRKKKRSAEGIGQLFAKAETEPKVDEKPESLWDWLSGDKKAETRSEKPAELPEIASEAEAPLDELAPAEKQFVERELVQQLAPVETAPDADEAEQIADQAVETFREKVVDEGKDSEAALAETLELLEPVAEAAEDEPAADHEQPQEFDPDAALNLRSTAEEEPEAPPPAAGAGSTPPPTPPSTPPPGGATPFGPLPRAAGPMSPSPDAPRVIERVEYVEGDTAGAFFLGGIIGYLIGRRRGRIKTEKKLRPVQKKLEKQVKQLKTELENKEFQIRRAAAETVRQQGRQVAERLEQAKIEKRSMNREATPRQSRQEAPEANQLHGKLPPERIGSVLINVEAESNPNVERAPALSADRYIEDLSTRDLLELSSKIVVEGTTLRKLYENKQLGERGLRRVVLEHLRGGNVRKRLRQELLQHEIDFERDPILRDRAQTALSGGGHSSLHQLLQKAEASMPSQVDDAPVLKARAAHQAAVQEREAKRRRLMDVTMISTITVLLAVVLVLWFSHH